jgi:hypothetical protein
MAAGREFNPMARAQNLVEDTNESRHVLVGWKLEAWYCCQLLMHLLIKAANPRSFQDAAKHVYLVSGTVTPVT